MRLAVAGLALCGLLDKALVLVLRIVELGEGISQLKGAGEWLEPFDKTRIVRFLFRERRDFFRIIHDKGRLD